MARATYNIFMDVSGPVTPIKTRVDEPPSFGRTILLIGGVCSIFCMVAAILLRMMPSPRREVDYLVIGGLSTLVAMVALFIVLITTWLRGEDTFFKRRRPE